jgi:predicted dehydrogenase
MHRIGIIGAGQSGHQHIERIRKIPEFEFAGIYDLDPVRAKQLHQKYRLPVFHNPDELIEHSDIVDIAGRHFPHFDLASQALRKSRHVFIDRPIIGSLNEVHKLADLAFEADVKVQIGHAERFNPAFKLVQDYIYQPGYIEAHRLLPLSPANKEVDVVMDMMIHDIDVVLNMVDSGIKRIQARGHAIDGQELDMVNAHIEFDNGCIANLSSSKMAQSEQAFLHIYQSDRSFHLDLTKGQVEQVVHNAATGHEERNILNVENKDFDPLQLGLESFKQAISQNTSTSVSMIDGSNALEVAFGILEKVAHWQGMNFKHL